MVSSPNLPFGRLLKGVAKLIDPTHKIGCCNIQGTFTVERTKISTTWFLDLLFIHSLDSEWFMVSIIISESGFYIFDYVVLTCLLIYCFLVLFFVGVFDPRGI